MLPDAVYLLLLTREWTVINHRLFGDALLVPPTLQTSDTLRELASWNPEQREIRFSRSFVASSKWAGVIEVLKHEMAHQYVSDVLGVEDETAHGRAFRMICDRYGIDARAAGMPKTDDEERVMDKIRKLLALGESPNEHEAKAAVAKARSLLDAYGPDAAIRCRMTDAGFGASNAACSIARNAACRPACNANVRIASACATAHPWHIKDGGPCGPPDGGHGPQRPSAGRAAAA